jgi:hypothetical protein
MLLYADEDFVYPVVGALRRRSPIASTDCFLYHSALSMSA